MKKILFVLPILTVAFVSCNKDNGDELSGDDIIQFKDPNFLKALLVEQEIEIYYDENGNALSETTLVNQNIDVNNDGQISIKEAKDVKYIGLYDSQTGTSSFNIKDISEIKYFTSLKSLLCFDNQLTSLDVSDNTALVELYCAGNQITYLNVNKCHSLKCIDCYENKLTSLDVSECTALEVLDFQGNPLKTLTISESQRNASWLDDVKSEYPNIEIIVK